MRFSLSLCIILFLRLPLFPQQADDIMGYYLVEDPFSKEKSQIQIYNNGDETYSAKVVWVENPEKVRFVGLLFLYGLAYDEENREWGKGYVKYPGKHGTYRIQASFLSPGKLKVRGYWGVSLLGMTLYWSKEERLRKP